MSIDLDAARAARREANASAPQVRFGGRDFVLPVELPFEMTEWGVRMRDADEPEDRNAAILGAMRLLLGDQYEAFMSERPSLADLDELITGVAKEYGLGLGESRASRRSSESTAKPSKRTSSRRTA